MNVQDVKMIADLQDIADDLWNSGGLNSQARRLEAIAIILAAAPATAVVQAEVGEAQVSAAARVLADRNAEACGVNKDDNWKIYGSDFIEDARLALSVARGAK